jgi:hypothetical protein
MSGRKISRGMIRNSFLVARCWFLVPAVPFEAAFTNEKRVTSNE